MPIYIDNDNHSNSNNSDDDDDDDNNNNDDNNDNNSINDNINDNDDDGNNNNYADDYDDDNKNSNNNNKRAHAETIHIRYTYRTISQYIHNQPSRTFELLYATLQQNACASFYLSRNPVTSSEHQSQ